ncbi:MAG: ASKHA domain-containing protein [Campylobacterota bacterium]|nr:ASKHA domain-containing protein [Campylobacterota bacterium]
MAKLSVSANDDHITVEFKRGESVKEILDQTSFRVRSACRGFGACGLCKVKVIKGEVNKVEEAEKLHLSQDELNSNIRLGCQLFPEKDLEIKIINLAPVSKWRSKTFFSNSSIYKESTFDQNEYPSIAEPLALAIDLGTTNISVVVFSLKFGQVLAERIINNPQTKYGDNVISRLISANESKESAKELQHMIIEIIADGLMDITTRDVIRLNDIVKVGIVGNTTMLSLLSNKNQKELLNPKKWDKYIDVVEFDEKEWIKRWGINRDARILKIKPIATFVGSDILAGIITTGLMQENRPSVLVDFGTNSEIALWTGKELLVTSASGGPAFEGTGFKFGMPAVSGAIYSANIKNSEEWEFKAVDNDKISGICGSGIIDIIANLIDENILTQTGSFNQKEQKWDLPIKEPDLYITKHDIDLIQRAKAAIITGIDILCKEVGIKTDSLQKVFIGGAFGLYLNIENSKKIGLIPNIKNNNIKIIGNSALNGCIDIIRYREAEEYIAQLENKIKIVNMSKVDAFDLLYLKNLFLKPAEEL